MGRPKVATVAVTDEQLTCDQLESVNVDNLAQLNINPTDLCFVRKGGEESGPYRLDDLAQYIDSHPDYVDDLLCADFLKSIWSIPFEFAPLGLNRRRPELIDSSSAEEEVRADSSFYLLISGQKSGPFNMAEIQAKLNGKEILFTDQVISADADKGRWKKIYDCPTFNRRVLEREEELPYHPSDESFQIASEEIRHNLNEKDSFREEAEDALVDLANIGRLQSNNSRESASNKEYHAEKSEDRPSHKKSKLLEVEYLLPKILAFILVVAVLLAGVSKYLSNMESRPQSDIKKREQAGPKVGRPVQVETPLERVRQVVPPPRHHRRPASRSRKSYSGKRGFQNSRAYKERKRRQKREERMRSAEDDIIENRDFDNGQDPIELDPIRSGQDRQTTNPVDDDEFDENDFIDEEDDFDEEDLDDEDELFEEEISF